MHANNIIACYWTSHKRWNFIPLLTWISMKHSSYQVVSSFTRFYAIVTPPSCYSHCSSPGNWEAHHQFIHNLRIVYYYYHRNWSKLKQPPLKCVRVWFKLTHEMSKMTEHRMGIWLNPVLKTSSTTTRAKKQPPPYRSIEVKIGISFNLVYCMLFLFHELTIFHRVMSK